MIEPQNHIKLDFASFLLWRVESFLGWWRFVEKNTVVIVGMMNLNLICQKTRLLLDHLIQYIAFGVALNGLFKLTTEPLVIPHLHPLPVGEDFTVLCLK